MSQTYNSITRVDTESRYLRLLSSIRSLLMIIKNVLLILIGSYGLSASLHIILRWWIPDGSTTISFFNTFAHLLWMPALVLFPLMLITRQWRIALTLALPTILFLSYYGYLFIPRQPPIILPTTKIINLQSHNLLANNRTPHRFTEIINDVSADIVALQEVSLNFEKRLDMIDSYPYKAIHGMSNNETLGTRETMGQAILSRYPILEDDYWSYDFLYKPLGHQRVVIDVEGQPIVIYNIHPTHPGMTGYAFFATEYRRQEFEDLMKRIQAETLPVIMMGDFNLNDLNYEYQLITQHLIDTYREVGQGMGLTFPDFGEANPIDSMKILPDSMPNNPPIPLLIRLDYVLHSEEFTGVSAYVYHSSGGSDHRPLVVQLALDTMDNHDINTKSP